MSFMSAIETNDSFVKEPEPLQQAIDKFNRTLKDSILICPLGSNNLSKKVRKISCEDAKVIAYLCFEGGLKDFVDNIRFTPENKISITNQKIPSQTTWLTQTYDSLPDFKHTVMFLDAMKSIKALSMSDYASEEVKKTLRSFEQEKYRNIQKQMISHVALPLICALGIILTTYSLNDPTLSTAALYFSAVCLLHSSIHFTYCAVIKNVYHKYLIPQEQ